MKLARPVLIALAAFALLATASSGNPAAARSALRSEAGAPPFCVMIGGARGTPLPQICRFFHYEQCLQAAADLHGNCVANIDYRGPPPDTAGATWARGAR